MSRTKVSLKCLKLFGPKYEESVSAYLARHKVLRTPMAGSVSRRRYECVAVQLLLPSTKRTKKQKRYGNHSLGQNPEINYSHIGAP